MIKKAFAFLAVTLMILVAVVPTITSVKMNNTNDNEQQINGIIYKEDYPDAPRDDPRVAYYYPNRVLVLFKDFVNISQIDRVEVERNSYQITEKIPEFNIALIEVTDYDIFDFIEKVEKFDGVECASVDSMRYLCDGPNDPYYQDGSQWGIEAINCDKAWKVPRNMELTWLTIIDSGIDTSHEDLKGANIHQWDILHSDGVADDETDEGHGTMVAGIAFARMNNGKGIAGVAGDAPNIEILKTFNATRKSPASEVIKALAYCTTKHKAPSVILMSFGGDDPNAVEEFVCIRVSSKHESLIIASVGNCGEEEKVYSPANYGSVIGVGAVNEDLELCWYPGNWGSNYNKNFRQVDIVAPGRNIITTTDPDKGGEKYQFWIGKTSAAAAFVAGVAMLWYGARAEKRGYIFRRNEFSECRHALYSNAMPRGEEEEKAPNKKYGWGLVDAYASIPKARTNEKTQIDFILNIIDNFPLLEKIFSNFFSMFFLDKNFENKVGGLLK